MINFTLAQGILDFFNELGEELFQCDKVKSLEAVFDNIIPRTVDYIYVLSKEHRLDGYNTFHSLYLLLGLLYDDIKFIGIIDYNKASKGEDLEQLKLLSLTMYKLIILDNSMLQKFIEKLDEKPVNEVIKFISFLETPSNWPPEQQWSALLYSKERQSLTSSSLMTDNCYFSIESLKQNSDLLSFNFVNMSRTKSMNTFVSFKELNSTIIGCHTLTNSFSSLSLQQEKEINKLTNVNKALLRDLDDIENEIARINEASNTMKKHLTEKIKDLEKKLSSKTSECAKLNNQTKQISTYSVRIENLLEENEKLRKNISEVCKENRELVIVNNEYEIRVYSLEQDLYEKKKEIDELRRNLIDKDNEIIHNKDKVLKDLYIIKEEKMELKKEINILTERIDELTKERLRFKEELWEERFNSQEQMHIIRSRLDDEIIKLNKIINLSKERDFLTNHNEYLKGETKNKENEGVKIQIKEYQKEKEINVVENNNLKEQIETLKMEKEGSSSFTDLETHSSNSVDDVFDNQTFKWNDSSYDLINHIDSEYFSNTSDYVDLFESQNIDDIVFSSSLEGKTQQFIIINDNFHDKYNFDYYTANQFLNDKRNNCFDFSKSSVEKDTQLKKLVKKRSKSYVSKIKRKFLSKKN
uniref:HOOK N-terminal domain-containing protein n=1 Tax=Parastrongyloides trichosuri TaxID=131310 RepID=A0A0N4ZET2_PARTI